MKKVRCKRCKRTLRDPARIALRIGRHCEELDRAERGEAARARLAALHLPWIKAPKRPGQQPLFELEDGSEHTVTTTTAAAQEDEEVEVEVSVTEVRRALVNLGNDDLRRRHPHFKVANGDAEPGDPKSIAHEAYMALLSAGTLAHALAAIMRYLDHEAPEHARVAAVITHEAMECGMEALEDANADLDIAPGPESGSGAK